MLIDGLIEECLPLYGPNSLRSRWQSSWSAKRAQ